MDNNVKFKMILRNNIKYNINDLSKLNNTDRQAFIKVMEYLEILQ